MGHGSQIQFCGLRRTTPALSWSEMSVKPDRSAPVGATGLPVTKASPVMVLIDLGLEPDKHGTVDAQVPNGNVVLKPASSRRP